jgi:maleylacetoacetate isomerase
MTAAHNDTVLYDYWRSSASYRVRIALNLAEIPYQAVSVDLLDQSHKSPEHLSRNPQGFVPVLDVDAHRFTQSLAILDYLDSTRDLGLLPSDPAKRAKTMALAHSVAVDVHPVCNLSVVGHVAKLTENTEGVRENWMRSFIAAGLAAFEALLSEFEQAPYCTGNAPSLADICLMPQLYNADRWGADYSTCTEIQGVKAACDIHPAFIAAHPDSVAPKST